MSAKPETTFTRSVNKHLPKEVYYMKNNNIYCAGVPDVWYSGTGGDLWVEYKFVVIPKRPDTVVKVELSELQKTWLRDRDAEGRDVGVIVGCAEGGVWFTGLSWDFEFTAEKFRAWVEDRKVLAGRIYSLIG